MSTEADQAQPRLVRGGRYSLDFAIEVAAQKYLDHMPLERQVRVMAREGLVIDSQTLWDQVEALARAAQRIYERLVAYILSLPVLGAESGLGKAISSMGGLWVSLVRFLDDPRIPLANNATERALRGGVVGRKITMGPGPGAAPKSPP